ncbi:MAG: hypothetical protein QOH09_649 [Pseudonocardiales bacterium]|jgi:hypothetical protein|nr:hypothetical protein [Pseudonocardiales bacterium]
MMRGLTEGAWSLPPGLPLATSTPDRAGDGVFTGRCSSSYLLARLDANRSLSHRWADSRPSLANLVWLRWSRGNGGVVSCGN